jgi:2-polyprenyl-3-methyl-5-hydroxy-6-metoxy-1,4-benzoquinol methylase
MIAAARRPTCYLCGRRGKTAHSNLRDRMFGVPGTWSFRVCSGCGLYWLDPVPEPGEFARLYRNYVTRSVRRTPSGGGRALWRQPAELKDAILAGDPSLEQERNALLQTLLWRIAPLREVALGSVLWLGPGAGRRLLDVGCGDGSFLARMRKRAWDVTGVEPDPAAVSVAKEKDLDVICATLEAARLPPNYFDVVTLNHVVEHVPDPIATVRECRRILRPGGRLIIVTPNSESLGRRLLGPWWRGWEPPRHFFVFSPTTLLESVRRSGFQQLKWRTSSKGARFVWQTSRLTQRIGSLPRGLPPDRSVQVSVESVAFWLLEYVVAKRFHVGEELVVIAVRDAPG